MLDSYLPYLLRRWNEGCRSAKRLHAEIRERGYRHSVDAVNRLLSSFHHTEQRGGKRPHAPRARRGSIAGASPSAKNVAALFMRREEMLNAEQKEYQQRLGAADVALNDARCDGGGLCLRGDDAAYGEAVGPCVGLSRQSLD